MHPEPAPPCSSPIVRMPAAIAADGDCRLPDAASRAAAHDGAPGTVVGDADQDGVDQTTLGGRRQPLVVQQEDEIGERRLLHQVEDVVSADPDVVGPASTIAVRHGSMQVVGLSRLRWRNRECYGKRTVTLLGKPATGANVPPATEMSFFREVRRETVTGVRQCGASRPRRKRHRARAGGCRLTTVRRRPRLQRRRRSPAPRSRSRKPTPA